MKRIKSLFQDRKTGSLAKDRLKVLLVSDRVGCGSEALEQLKEEIIYVVSKYMEVNAENVTLQVTHTRHSQEKREATELFAHIPIADMKHVV